MTEQPALPPATPGDRNLNLGDVSGQSGGTMNVVGGNQINYQLDVARLAEVLREALPANDPAPANLVNTLKQFRIFHDHLYEWKEVHNFINDIAFDFDQFFREVDRVAAQALTVNRRLFRSFWRPVSRKVGNMLEWAETIRFIGPAYALLDDGSMQGPPWAVEISGSHGRIEALLGSGNFDIGGLYDAAADFSDTTERHLYLADKRLRETAGELSNLSRIVLGSLPSDD